MIDLTRRAGILLHPTSLPGPFGIGDLGPAAEAWIRWLAQARQTIWQILPLGPTGYGNSPYQSLSAFAGNPLLISPERLVEGGLVSRADLDPMPAAAVGPRRFRAGDRLQTARAGACIRPIPPPRSFAVA